MSRIFFVRHGQASFLKTDYDQLSELGHEQARALGRFWKGQDMKIDLAYSGSLRRQQETAAGCLEGLGDSDSEVNVMSGFNEHFGPGIVKGYYPERFHLEKEIDPKEFHKYRREFYGTYFKLAIPWVNGELDPEKTAGVEPWSDFRQRFTEAFEQVMADCPSGTTMVIYTSGGVVGASVGHALKLDDEQTLKLGWQVKNGSFTEYLYSKGNLSLVSFNETPHLTTPELQTLV